MWKCSATRDLDPGFRGDCYKSNSPLSFDPCNSWLLKLAQEFEEACVHFSEGEAHFRKVAWQLGFLGCCQLGQMEEYEE